MHGGFLLKIDVGLDPISISLDLRLTVLLSSAGLVNMRIRIHIAYGLIAATYVTTICSILLGCRPLEKNWQINPNPGSTCPMTCNKNFPLIVC